MKFQVLFLVCVSVVCFCGESYAFGRRYYRYSQPQSYSAPVQPQQTAPAPVQPVPEAKPVVEGLHPVEQELLEKLNAQRTARGLPPFVIDPNIQQTCRHHCSWMANMRSMVHSRMNVAENIACGQPSADHAIGSWIRSAGHAANIFNWGHRRTGVAAYQGSDGRIYWCQQFAP